MSSHFGVKCLKNWQNHMWSKLCFVTRNMQCLPTTLWIAPHHLWLKKRSKLKKFSRKKLYVEKAATKNTPTIHWNKWIAGWPYCGIKTFTTESSTTKHGNSWFCWYASLINTATFLKSWKMQITKELYCSFLPTIIKEILFLFLPWLWLSLWCLPILSTIFISSASNHGRREKRRGDACTHAHSSTKWGGEKKQTTSKRNLTISWKHGALLPAQQKKSRKEKRSQRVA